MSIKYSILSTMLAGVALTACSSEPKPPPKAETKPASVAGSFSSNAAEAAQAPAASTPEPSAVPVQAAPVGIPGPGQVAFGPAPAGSGFRPQGDAEMQRYREMRQQQAAAAAKQGEAAADQPARQ